MSNLWFKEYPEASEAQDMVKAAIEKRRSVLIAGDCRVDYHGRSSSTIGWGERFVFIKEDRALLVHRPVGYEAVNWQPPGSLVSVSGGRQMCVIRSIRRSPPETLTITFREISFVAALKMVDAAEFEMYLTELDLYDLIRRRPDLIEPGLRIASEQKGMRTGVADITGYDSKGTYVVIEVKKKAAGTDSVKQAYKYVAEMRKTEPRVRSIIAAPSISRDASRLAKSLNVEFVPLDMRSLSKLLSYGRGRGRKGLQGGLTLGLDLK